MFPLIFMLRIRLADGISILKVYKYDNTVPISNYAVNFFTLFITEMFRPPC